MKLIVIQMDDCDGVRSKMGASFWLPLESYTGFRNRPLWSPPNLDHIHCDACIRNDWVVAICPFNHGTRIGPSSVILTILLS